MAKILTLHGPNLNLLGEREPEHYAKLTLEEINKNLLVLAMAAEHEFETLQSNAENVLVDRVHKALADGVDFILINPAAFTHTSIALRDAMSAVKIPFIEIHLSNIYSREEFRQTSYFSDLAIGVISGFGLLSYEMAMSAAVVYLNDPPLVE